MALPGVISTNPSPHAWTRTPGLTLVHIPVSSQATSAFAVSGAARQNTMIRTATSVRGRLRGCSHSLMFRPADLLATQVAPTAVLPLGSRGFYVRASCGLLPSCTSDMLAARIGQLTAWGLAPHQIRGLAGRSLETLPSPILGGMSSPRSVAPRLAARHFRRQPSHAGGAVDAAIGKGVFSGLRSRSDSLPP
jgi:hypothetical protein